MRCKFQKIYGSVQNNYPGEFPAFSAGEPGDEIVHDQSYLILPYYLKYIRQLC